jgi:predicted MPP superfamily phosphohydrolase
MSRITCVSLSLAILLFLLAGYALFIEPNWLQVTRYEVDSPLRKSIKVAQLSELHIQKIGYLEKSVLRVLQHEKPDVIVITGDTVPNHGSMEKAGEFLALLEAPLGVFAIDGNWEHWREQPFPRRLSSNTREKVSWLQNTNREIAGGFWLVGLDDSTGGVPDPKSAFSGITSDKFCILLLHSPGYFPEVAGKCPLVLSGHTHGGQIRFPFLGPLWLPPGSGEYVQGWYSESGSGMYVNRGIGTSIINARFLARPELTLFSIRGKL